MLRNLTTLAIAATLSFGAQLVEINTAEAAPGGTLVRSTKGGTRTHKAAKSNSKSTSKSTTKKTTTRTTTTRTAPTRTRTTTTRSSAPSRTTRTTTTRRTSPGARTTTTYRTSRPSSTTRTTTYHSSPRRTVHHRSSRNYRSSGSTTYYSTHYHSSSAPRTTTTYETSAPSAEAYLTGGLGLSGFASNAIVDGALPGLGYNVALGVKGGLLGGELGLNGGAFTFTPGDLPTDLGVFGMSLDFKVQPSFGIFEPFVSAGIGIYGLADGVISERSVGAGFRLGAGADLRFDNVALRLGYHFNGYLFDNAYDAYGPGSFTARTEALTANLVVYF